ncbi:MAG: thiamine phosphate synthase [Betaproteobacteria bacterium]|nr:MAG: thiamine phosphate synthase [Betaproteobacteria bacterium]TMG77844.1 MAG: thiamine phosphate synthase [Betaproteobacteria bacterium]
MSRAQARIERSFARSLGFRGLYAVTPDEPDTEVLTHKVRKALAGGAHIVQYRNKSANARLRLEQGAELLALCRTAGVPLIVNDDLDLALAIGADGLHLGRGDTALATARTKLGEHRLLGASCYDRLELALAACSAGADYVAFGSAFPSATKPGATPAPLGLYREARVLLDSPIVAIGGITPENARTVIEAGADAVAVISALFDAPDIEAAARRFERLFRKKER